MALRRLFATPIYEASLSTDPDFENFRAELEAACRMLAAEDRAGQAGRGPGGVQALRLPAAAGGRGADVGELAQARGAGEPGPGRADLDQLQLRLGLASSPKPSSPGGRTHDRRRQRRGRR